MNALHPTEYRTASDVALQPEPVCFCADCVEDSDPPLAWMLMWAALAIPCWLVFGWCVATVIRWFA